MNNHKPPKPLDQMRNVLRAGHYSIRTEEPYPGWVKRVILRHGKKHPSEMGEPEVSRFLTHPAVYRNVSPFTQAQDLRAILFLYRDVPDREIGLLGKSGADETTIRFVGSLQAIG